MIWEAVDGLGWLFTKRCLLMKTFGWNAEHVRKGITGAQGWAYWCWAMENEMTVWGVGVKRATLGYVKQEAERLKRQNG